MDPLVIVDINFFVFLLVLLTYVGTELIEYTEHHTYRVAFDVPSLIH